MHPSTFPPLALTVTLILTRTLTFTRTLTLSACSPAPAPSPDDQAASTLFDLPVDQWQIKLLLRGKSLHHTGAAADALAPATAPPSATPPKLMVMATAREAIARVHSATPDAAVPSFAAEHGGRKARVPTSRGGCVESGRRKAER